MCLFQGQSARLVTMTHLDKKSSFPSFVEPEIALTLSQKSVIGHYYFFLSFSDLVQSSSRMLFPLRSILILSSLIYMWKVIFPPFKFRNEISYVPRGHQIFPPSHPSIFNDSDNILLTVRVMKNQARDVNRQIVYLIVRNVQF
jgi:hypothetical protein